ncbi:methyltransferase [Fusarium mexicanum]|uniref:Methyltransferase n=1 Tax=Fusarium mexicanum TaxID=751941 RepID=A0A8H5J0L3_9HYPO|nr:methyltransferase [Fusarium mexicanum]
MAETHEQPVVPDEQEDNESTLGEDSASTTASVSESIFNYRCENGRTYHAYKDGKYVLPNDEKENERLDLQHNLFLLTFGDKLGLAPPCYPDTKVNHVLDLGTGTGIWAMDFADEHPEAELWFSIPPNVTFEIDDIEDEWTYSKPFDYIHGRFVTSCISDWKKYLTQCFQNLTPNGYLELQEADLTIKSDDDTVKPDNPLLKCLKLLQEASERFGRPYVDIPALVDVMTEIGFVDVKIERFRWPSNSWPKDKKFKELGAWCYENFSSGLEAITMAALTRGHGWSVEDTTVFLMDVRKSMGDRKIHAYWPIYSIYGRKP